MLPGMACMNEKQKMSGGSVVVTLLLSDMLNYSGMFRLIGHGRADMLVESE